MKAILLLFLIVPLVVQCQFRNYYNDRFEISIKYPSNFKADSPPGNNDGRSFSSPDRRGQISCSGHYYFSNNMNEELKSYTDNISISYKTLNQMLSHFQAILQMVKSTIKKSVLKKLSYEDNYVLKSVWITYPADQKKYYEKIIKVVAASLN